MLYRPGKNSDIKSAHSSDCLQHYVQFVSDFLEIGLVEGYVPGYPTKDTDHTYDFRLLAGYTDWALPIIEERLTQWMIAPEANSNAISNVTNAITYCKAMKASTLLRESTQPALSYGNGLASTSMTDTPL